jgi:hypothetical protein
VFVVLVLVLEKAIPPQALRTAAQCWRPTEGLREKTLFEDEDDDEYENEKQCPHRLAQYPTQFLQLTDLPEPVLGSGTMNLLPYDSLYWGWIGMVAGIVSGAVIGLFFHKERWLGGYNSFPRRLVRLGHISFFGLGILSVLMGITVRQLAFDPDTVRLAGRWFFIGQVTMPACCFLTAWRSWLRHLFPVPVLSLGTAVSLLLWRWPHS